MSTPTIPTDDTTSRPAARPASRRRAVLLGVTGAVAAAAIAGGFMFDLTGAAPAPAAPAPAAAPSTPAAGSGTAQHHVTPPEPPAPPAPSAAIKTLQSELAQLNYYEGPITGVMNTQTHAAIGYLQRDAHLPQTGTMNAATQVALAHFLATGNNQMGG